MALLQLFERKQGFIRKGLVSGLASDSFRQVVDIKEPAIRQHACVSNYALHLPNVSGPRIGCHAALCPSGQARNGLLIFRGKLLNEESLKKRQILTSICKRRQADL